VLEVQFSRGVINEIDGYFKSIHQVSRAENLGEVVAEKVRFLLIHQPAWQNVLAALSTQPFDFALVQLHEIIWHFLDRASPLDQQLAPRLIGRASEALLEGPAERRIARESR
jgi:hypothetical protein